MKYYEIDANTGNDSILFSQSAYKQINNIM